MSEVKCKQEVWGARGYHHPCINRTWKNGYCKIHHPDSVKARQEKSRKKYEAEMNIIRARREKEKNNAAILARLDDDGLVEEVAEEFTGSGDIGKYYKAIFKTIINDYRKRVKEG